MKKSSAWKMVCMVFVFCAAAVIASPAQTLTTLVNFDWTNGANPQSSLTQGTDGNFYGTTENGGAYTRGTVFKITPSGALTTLHSFTGGSDGANPYAGLVQATDGNFYGTSLGGAYGDGTVFKITPGGTLTTLHSFGGTDGANPTAGLVQATDGNFYGTTEYGGASYGTVFKITPSGMLTTLLSFDLSDGAYPWAGLVQASDGNFYGTTGYGGASNNCGSYSCGTVFKITPGGTLTTLHSFQATDGANPFAGLVQATDGNFYGTTSGGAAYSGGTVFKITQSGTLTTLYSFCAQTGCTDGDKPTAGLVQATDGNFYGTTHYGGYNQAGTVFKITPGGTLTTLYGFCAQTGCTDGTNPSAGLVQATNGSFYGTTYAGGTYNEGTVFSLSVGLTQFVETQPTSGEVGTPVIILGTNLTGATSVTFNGTAATFNVLSASEITTTVPAGATTGTVQVTIPGSTLISNTVFQVMGPLQFVPITPCRLVDTRSTHDPIQGGTSRGFTIPQLGGCNIPSSAAAYSLNVTVVPHGSLGYLTVWPTGEDQPLVATLNSLDGRIKADAAIVPASNDSVSVYVTDTTDVVLDIDGYFAAPSGQTLQFYPLTPCRVADTRKNNFPPGLGSPYLPGHQERDFPILNATSCNIPSGAAAYSLNFSVVPHGPLGYMTVWPTGQPRPVVSTLNDIPGTIIANAAIVPAGTSGEVSVYPSNDTDLIIDINGYFDTPGAGGLSLYAVAPCRVIDTRKLGPPFSGTLSPPVDVVDSPCEPPMTAEAYVFNATVAPQGALGYLTLWPDGEPQPLVSTLNALDGSITNNMAIVPSTDGKVDAYASGITQLILDISSYFAP